MDNMKNQNLILYCVFSSIIISMISSCQLQLECGVSSSGGDSGGGCEHQVFCEEDNDPGTLLDSEDRGGFICDSDADGGACRCLGEDEVLNPAGENLCATGSEAGAVLLIRERCSKGSFSFAEDYCQNSLDGSESECEELAKE